MKSIFEGAKFGDKFLARTNERALYIGISNLLDDLVYECYVENNGITYCDTNGICIFPNKKLDIVSNYQEPIDEEKLNELAKSEAFIYGTCFADVSHSTMINRENGFYEGFKAGYCKAKEEKI